jgi:hypothetical protein
MKKQTNALKLTKQNEAGMSEGITHLEAESISRS